MNTINVLLVAYSFPPAGGVGVQRAASLARYLPNENIRLDVLTAHNASAVGSDPSLLSDIPSDVAIHRTITLDLPFGIKKRIKRLIGGGKKAPVGTGGAAVAEKPSFFKRILGDTLLPDPQITWLPILTFAARRIVRRRKIDLVLITAPPYSSLLLVEKLRKTFPGLAIVIDFRDEWLSTSFDFVSFLFSRSERARKLATDSEASAVTKATAVVAVSRAALRRIRSRYPKEPDSKFQLIPNGFDASRLPRSAPSGGYKEDGKIVVTYIGTVYSSTEPGALVQAIQSLPADVRDRFRLRFIGHIEEPRFREKLLQLGDMVELKGFMPQHEALAALNDTDYVLLIAHDPLNVGAKFYDYVGGRKPILAVVDPDGDVRRLLEELRAGWWAGNRDVDGIRKLFSDAAARGESLLSEFQPDLKKIAMYERKIIAQKYANLLHSIVDNHMDREGKPHFAEPDGAGDQAC
jgi:hypothetical protein